MKGKVSIQNHTGHDRVTINIEGIIGVPEQMQFEETGDRISTFNSLWTLLDRVTGHSPRSVTVNIRSTGGSVSDALLIYDFLKSCGAQVTTRCFGYAASAATVIAQAASPGMREISANCLYLVHNSSCETEGNRLEMESAAGMLRQTDERIAGIYALNSGRCIGEFASLMGENGGKGRWLSPQEALGYGLADTVIESSGLGRKDRRMVRNLGLPPVPRKSILGNTVKSAGKIISQALGVTMEINPVPPSGDSSVIPEKIKVDTARQQPAANRDKVRIPSKSKSENPPGTGAVAQKSWTQEPDVRKSIAPVTTQPKEDPSVYGQGLPGNQEAYLEDVRRIKTL